MAINDNNMKTFFTKVWDWKYRNHAICFLVGIVISTIFWLSFQVKDFDLMQKTIDDHVKETQVLKDKFVPVGKLLTKIETLEKEIIELKSTTITKRTAIYKKGNNEIDKIFYTTDEYRQRFINEWSDKNGGNIDVPE